MHIWFNTNDYGKNRDIVFLEKQKYTGKPKFGKLLIKKGWPAWRLKKTYFQTEIKSLNVFYFLPMYGTICTTYVRYNMYMALYFQPMYGTICTTYGILLWYYECNTRASFGFSLQGTRNGIYPDSSSCMVTWREDVTKCYTTNPFAHR